MNRLSLMLCVVLLTPCWAGAQPELIAKLADIVPPIIDGQVKDEPVWEIAGLHTRLTGCQEGKPAQTTQIAVVFNDDFLYVAFVCTESDPARLVAPWQARDAEMVGQDAVEVALWPTPEAQEPYRFLINARGCLTDSLGADRAFNARATAAAATWEGGWSAELRVPWADLRPDFTATSQWRANFFRQAPGAGEQSCWAPVGDQQPGWGTLRGLNLNWPAAIATSLWTRLALIQRETALLRAAVAPYAQLSYAGGLQGAALRYDRQTTRALTLLANSQPGNPAQREALKLITHLERDQQRSRLLASRLKLAAAAGDKDYAVCRLIPGTAGQPAQLEVVSSLALTLAPGETTSLDLLVVPLRSGTLRQLQVTADATGGGPPTRCTPLPATTSGASLSAVDLPRTGLQHYKLILQAEEGQQPGRHEGLVTVSAEGVSPQRLPLVIHIK
jgi:hypothetical protein